MTPYKFNGGVNNVYKSVLNLYTALNIEKLQIKDTFGCHLFFRLNFKGDFFSCTCGKCFCIIT